MTICQPSETPTLPPQRIDNTTSYTFQTMDVSTSFLTRQSYSSQNFLNLVHHLSTLVKGYEDSLFDIIRPERRVCFYSSVDRAFP